MHGTGGLFEEPGEFPSAKYVDFPLSKDARRFYTSGPSFLRRYLPFWAANLVDRLKIMPPLYRWRIRSRVYRWYSELEEIDPIVQKGVTAAEVEKYLAELDRIEEKVSNVSIPLSYSEELYDLRLHIEMLRNKLRKPSAVD